MTEVRTAKGFIALYMRTCSFNGWASFWNVIYVMPGYEGADWLIRHEQIHLDQIKYLGWFKFSFHYLYWLLKVGYQNHPMEIEARKAEWPIV